MPLIEIKAKVNKWDLIKLISFCTAKEIINKTKRQFIEWEKKFANNVTDKELYLSSKYIIQTAYAAQYRKKTTIYQKWAEDLNRHFLKK